MGAQEAGGDGELLVGAVRFADAAVLGRHDVEVGLERFEERAASERVVPGRPHDQQQRLAAAGALAGNAAFTEVEVGHDPILTYSELVRAPPRRVLSDR